MTPWIRTAFEAVLRWNTHLLICDLDDVSWPTFKEIVICCAINNEQEHGGKFSTKSKTLKRHERDNISIQRAQWVTNLVWFDMRGLCIMSAVSRVLIEPTQQLNPPTNRCWNAHSSLKGKRSQKTFYTPLLLHTGYNINCNVAPRALVFSFSVQLALNSMSCNGTEVQQSPRMFCRRNAITQSRVVWTQPEGLFTASRLHD